MQAEALILLIANGDENAFRQLYELFKDKVYNTCLSYLQNKEEAEEAAQDVFVEVFHSAHKFKQRSSVSTWVYRITVNKCLDRLRYRSRQKRFAFISSLFNKTTGELQHDAPAFEHPGILLEQKEHAAKLFAAIARLVEQQQTAFILRQVEGLSQKEISQIMDLSEKAVESLIQRAKANLRKILSE